MFFFLAWKSILADTPVNAGALLPTRLASAVCEAVLLVDVLAWDTSYVVMTVRPLRTLRPKVQFDSMTAQGLIAPALRKLAACPELSVTVVTLPLVVR